MNIQKELKNILNTYKINFNSVFDDKFEIKTISLANKILNCWKKNKNIFIIGNGGSGANAIHLANDLLYGAGFSNKKGIKIEALNSNQAVITCLSNDVGYEFIFSEQIKVKGGKGDLLIILSGSGNSKNIIEAIKISKKMKIDTFGIIGFDGGKSKKLLDDYIHILINDMQIVEDFQMVVGHVCSKFFSRIKL